MPHLPCYSRFERDEAPPRFRNTVCRFLNELFPNKWKRWYPTQRQRTFYFGGYVKNIVYQVKSADLQTLQHHIAKAIVTVRLMNKWREIKYSFNVSINEWCSHWNLLCDKNFDICAAELCDLLNVAVACAMEECEYDLLKTCRPEFGVLVEYEGSRHTQGVFVNNY